MNCLICQRKFSINMKLVYLYINSLLRWSENIKVWRNLSLCQTKPYGLLLIEALQYIRWNSCFVSFPEYLSMESIYIAEHMGHLLSSLGIYFSTHTLSRPTCWAALFLLKESHFFFHLLSFSHRLELIIHRNENIPSFIFLCQNFYTLKQILIIFSVLFHNLFHHHVKISTLWKVYSK